ncbi:MAG TPA: DUF6597 domain-containing transcriptional factor [Candidatus Angelobacter sp.]
MISHLHRPGPPLAQFVDLFWYYEGISRPHSKERLLPQGTVELVINLRENPCRVYDRIRQDEFQGFPGTLVCGPHSNFFIIDTAGQAEVLGVHFRPGGVFPFLRLPADEMQNRHVGLDDLWGARAAELRERVLAAPTPQCKVQVLERRISSTISRSFPGSIPQPTWQPRPSTSTMFPSVTEVRFLQYSPGRRAGYW